VALARAIVRRPSVFLMDEPLSNLDAKMRTATRAELVELHERLGTTFVYVTHDQVEAMTMGSRVAVLNDGRLQQVGPPQEVYDSPANVFVAQFIGSPPMNVVPAAVTGGLVAAGPGTKIGVRPEHLHFADDGVPAHVRVVEALGHERHVLCRIADAVDVIVRVPSSEPTPAEGADVHLVAEPAHILRFDGETGQRL
jgi:ABC-type sugar transport system ATPase subunit